MEKQTSFKFIFLFEKSKIQGIQAVIMDDASIALFQIRFLSMSLPIRSGIHDLRIVFDCEANLFSLTWSGLIEIRLV